MDGDKKIYFRTVLEKLHQRAVGEINKLGMSFLFQDTAFDKEGSFMGHTGPHLLVVVFKDSGKDRGSVKSDGIKIIHSYLQNLTGSDFQSVLDKEKLFEVTTLTHKEQEPNSENVERGKTEPANTDKTEPTELVSERVFMTIQDRMLMETLERIFEESPNPEDLQVVGCAVGYTLTVGANNGGGINANVAAIKDGFMRGQVRPDELRIDGMDANTLLDVRKFVSAFDVRSSQILTNLHQSAAASAIKKIGMKKDAQLNQFVVNSGMTDDGERVSNANDTANYGNRFSDKNGFDVGIIMVDKTIEGEDDKSREESNGVDRNKALDGIKDYFKWFCGDEKVETDLTEFRPVYDGGKVRIENGRILDSAKNNQKKAEQAKETRVGYKVGYNLVY